MSFGNAAHHHHHGKQYPHWDTSDSYLQYQVFESTEVMPEKLNLYPEVYESYNINRYEERDVVIHDQTPERVRVRTEYEFAPQQPLKPSHHHYHHHVDSEDVDKEAEEFIKAEHRMFGLSKMMSRTDGRLRPYK